MTSGVLYIIGNNIIFYIEQEAMDFAIHHGYNHIDVYQRYSNVDLLIGIIIIPQ
jgi:hypothetical protein